MRSFTEKKNTGRERGFTIVEVLISLTIFSIAIAGVITVAAQGGLNVNASKMSVTATYLADEGVELMRAMRDTAVLGAGAGAESAGWAAFTSSFGATACTAASPCDIDPTGSSSPFPSVSNVVSCASGGYCPLYVTTAGGAYTDLSVGAALSPYSRQIVVTPMGSGGNEVRVTVKVKYLLGTVPETITASEDLFNWY